jgi:hypothetical protein
MHTVHGVIMFTITGMFAVLWMVFAVAGIFEILRDLEVDGLEGWLTQGERWYIVEEEMVEAEITGLGLTEQEWWDMPTSTALEVPAYMAGWPDGEEQEVQVTETHALDLTQVHMAMMAFWRNNPQYA